MRLQIESHPIMYNVHRREASRLNFVLCQQVRRKSENPKRGGSSYAVGRNLPPRLKQVCQIWGDKPHPSAHKVPTALISCRWREAIGRILLETALLRDFRPELTQQQTIAVRLLKRGHIRKTSNERSKTRTRSSAFYQHLQQ